VEAAGGKALPCVVDIRDEQQVGAAVQKAVETFGGKYLSLLFRQTEVTPLFSHWFSGCTSSVAVQTVLPQR